MRQLEELAKLLPALPLPVDAARSYGALRAELEAGGRVIGNNDLWIAAHARAAKLILVTNNEREFQRASGLEVQNWTKSEGPTSSMRRSDLLRATRDQYHHLIAIAGAVMRSCAKSIVGARRLLRHCGSGCRKLPRNLKLLSPKAITSGYAQSSSRPLLKRDRPCKTGSPGGQRMLPAPHMKIERSTSDRRFFNNADEGQQSRECIARFFHSLFL